MFYCYNLIIKNKKIILYLNHKFLKIKYGNKKIIKNYKFFILYLNHALKKLKKIFYEFLELKK